MIQESTPTLDTHLSFGTTCPILHNDPCFSQVPQVKKFIMSSIYNLFICQHLQI